MQPDQFTIDAKDLRTRLTALCGLLNDSAGYRGERLDTIQWHVSNNRAVLIAADGYALIEYALACNAPDVDLHIALPLSSMNTLRKMLKDTYGDVDVSVGGLGNMVWDFGIGADMLRVCATHTPINVSVAWTNALNALPAVDGSTVAFDPALVTRVFAHAPRPCWIQPGTTESSLIVCANNYRALVMPLQHDMVEAIAPGSLLPPAMAMEARDAA